MRITIAVTINIHAARTLSSAFFATRELAQYVPRALRLCKHVRSRSMHMHTCTRANRESRRIGARRGPRAVACHERTCRERVSPVLCMTTIRAQDWSTINRDARFDFDANFDATHFPSSRGRAVLQSEVYHVPYDPVDKVEERLIFLS